MTAETDPKRGEPRLAGTREGGFGGRRDPGEPRFAGPPTTATRAAPPGAPPSPPAYPSAPYPSAPYPSAPAAPTAPPPGGPPPSAFPAPSASTFPAPPANTFPAPPEGSDLEPVVDFGPGMHYAPEPRDGLLLSRIGSGVAVAGGLMAGIGSLFTWATLRLNSTVSDSSGFTTDPSSISYNGLSLLEGRVILVLGIVAIGLAGAAVPLRAPRLIAFVLAGVGGLAVVVMAFAAIGHPVELATLFRSYRQIDAVKVSLPNGVGTWLAVIGALLILAGGLLALMRGNTEQARLRESTEQARLRESTEQDVQREGWA